MFARQAGRSAVTRRGREEARAILRPGAAVVGPCLLLLLAECPSHGYELAERLQDFGLGETGANSLYRELRRLEEAGLVCSTWEATQARGPARRVYQLTAAGSDALVGCAEDAEELGRTLQRYVRRVRAATRRLSVPMAQQD